MRCGTCNYPSLETAETTVEEWDGNELIVIRDVPIEKCPQCGEEYFEPAVLRELEALIAHRHTSHALQPAQVIQVPVFRYVLTTVGPTPPAAPVPQSPA